MRKQIKLTPRLVLAVFILFNLAAGVFIAGDYGFSTDESPEGMRSQLALKLYTSNIDFNPVAVYEELGLVQYYGTASTVIARAASTALAPLLNVPAFVVIHYVYFVLFQIGVAAFYFLAANFMPEWIALLSAVLFGTQPLLFGHAFINPKDIPLMSLFIATVASGFYMVDKLSTHMPPIAPTTDKQSIKKQNRLLILLLLGAAMVLFKGLLHPLLTNVVTYAYNAPESNLAYKIFKLFTTQGSLEGYLTLLELAIYNLYKWIALLFLLILLFFGYQAWRHKLFAGWINLPVLLAGAVWGFAISTRIIALAAGGIVGLYALAKLQKKGIPYLVSYSLSAAAVSYLTWPYIWLFGIKGWVDSLLKFSEFSWEGLVLFEGQLYTQATLPARYIPKLMLLQFTEPLVILAILGLIASLYLLVKKKLPPVKTGLVYAWFALPLLYSLLADTINYNNFRQFLFITPPLFILAGLALRLAAVRLNRKLWLALLVIIVLLPGLISLVQLHPYQYVYYNQFTGGVAGAYRQYELDYWLTSYKEIMAYLDENVPPGSRVLIWINDHRLKLYAKNEYKFVTHSDIPAENYTDFEYAVLPTTDLIDQLNLPGQRVIYRVMHNDAVLAVVKKID